MPLYRSQPGHHADPDCALIDLHTPVTGIYFFGGEPGRIGLADQIDGRGETREGESSPSVRRRRRQQTAAGIFQRDDRSPGAVRPFDRPGGSRSDH